MNCQTCTNPTKHAIGFWDGENSHGQLFDCHNLDCELKQDRLWAEEMSELEKDEVDRKNLFNEISMKMIKDKRRELQITIMKMSQGLGISPSEYSNYEMCRVALPVEMVDKINEVFKEQHRNRMEERIKGMYP